VGVTLRRCIEALEAAIGDPRRGLPEEIFRFVSRITPLINVDLLIPAGQWRWHKRCPPDLLTVQRMYAPFF
jgi:hypothetical protein